MSTAVENDSRVYVYLFQHYPEYQRTWQQSKKHKTHPDNVRFLGAEMAHCEMVCAFFENICICFVQYHDI